MPLLTRAPTRHYFISIFVIFSALLVTFSTVIYQQYNATQRLNELALYHYEVIRQSRRVLLDLVDMETGVRGYLLTSQKRFLEPYENSQKTLPERIKQLWVFTKKDSTAHTDIDNWLQKIKEFSILLNHQVEALNSKDKSGILPEMLDKQKQKMDSLRTLLEGQIQTRLKNLQKEIAASKETQHDFKYILAIGTLLAVGGMLLGTIVILSLINTSQRAEEEARLVENRFLTVMSGVNDGLYDFNLLDGTIYYSPSYKEMLGYTEEEHPNTVEMFNSTIAPEDHENAWDVLRQYQEGLIPIYSNIFRLRHKEGHWLWILSRGVGIKNSHGKMARIIGTHTDITEQKTREQELKRLNDEMETFTYITSHDLRAPLVNLKGFAGEIQYTLDKIKPFMGKAMPSLIQEDQLALTQALEKDLPEALRFIVQSVEKMDALTTALLDLSRIGKREYRFEPVDTQTIMKRCVDTLGYEIAQKNIQVTYENLPTVVSDPLALEQIFSNILDNAVKYLEPERRGEITVTANETENHFVFSISDNGRGIARADTEKVFQIFRRARNTSDVRGCGMGMTFVKATLRQLDGTIWFDSIPGSGTTFYISLPKNVKLKRLIG